MANGKNGSTPKDNTDENKEVGQTPESLTQEEEEGGPRIFGASINGEDLFNMLKDSGALEGMMKYVPGKGDYAFDVLDGQHWTTDRPAPTIRVRVNVSASVKGIETADSTLEITGDVRDVDLRYVMGMREALSLLVEEAYPKPLTDPEISELRELRDTIAEQRAERDAEETQDSDTQAAPSEGDEVPTPSD